MPGIFVLFGFLIMGVFQAHHVFYEKHPFIRVWLGMVMGLIEMMWLPSIFAYAFDFTLTANLCAVAASLVLCVPAFIYGRKNKGPGLKTGANRDYSFVLAVIFPAVLVTAFLQYTHSFVNVDGALHVGQSTYGDLCMHAGFASGLIGQSYPPEYTILPGTKLGYPFLMDALSSTMLLFGTPLSQAIYIPGIVFSFLMYAGFVIFAYELTGSKWASALSFFLFFFSGGLGFMRLFDENGLDMWRVNDTLFGYYQAPTNIPDENLRWVNALSDLLIPQRTLLAGWTCLMPCLYLLTDGMREKKMKPFIVLGIWAGALPMIHTHSFLALGAVSLGCLVYSLVIEKERLETLVRYGIYGLIACAIAFPQLLEWTFPQTIEGESLRIRFNWVNNNGVGGLRDNYFWFWLNNVGVMYVVFPFAAVFSKNRAVKALSLGALLLYAVSEVVIFQPNDYDNIKLFYVCYLVMLPIGANALVKAFMFVWGRGKAGMMIGLRRGACAVVAWVFLIVSSLSGAFTILRECISDEVIFSAANAEAGAYIYENTPEGSVFLTYDQHNNPVSVIGGRKIICGAGLYLYFHGVDYSTQRQDMVDMLTDPRGTQALYEKYGVDYVFISSYERGMGANVQAFDEMYPVVYESRDSFDSVTIYRVTEE